MGPDHLVLLDRLTAINLEDVLISLGWQNVPIARRGLAWLFKDLARRFARQVMDYDLAVRTHGLHAGSHFFLKTLLKELVIEGQEHIPPEGPILFLSNHPGLTDTLSLFASIPRTDLRVVAADRPFLRSLPGTAPRLIYVSENEGLRLKALRTVIAHLGAGGAVLTFPRGEIEPDPGVLAGACQSLERWSSSIGLFARCVPGLVLSPVIVSGVLAPKASLHPITHLRRQPKDRERLGAMLQILAGVYHPQCWRQLWNVSVHVRFAPSILANELLEFSDPELITQVVIGRVRPFLADIVQKKSRPKP